MTYRSVGYFDPVEWRDAMVCDVCGAVVHPTAMDDHDQWHQGLHEHLEDDSRHRQ